MESLRIKSLFSSLVLFVLVSSPTLSSAASLGINYGQLGNNLPQPTDVIALINSIGATKAKLYDANPQILSAFANTSIEFMVAIGNNLLSSMGDPQQALTWVKSNVQTYLPATKITGIMVGNEVLTLNNTELSNNLVPAMKSVYAALVSLGLDKSINVTTAHSLDIMEYTYPPSTGAFKQDYKVFMQAILSFHVQTGSPFYINMYPFFAYTSSPNEIDLNYVLFEPNNGFSYFEFCSFPRNQLWSTWKQSSSAHRCYCFSSTPLVQQRRLLYDNMLFAQIDAVYSAITLLGYKGVSICESETGWPSKGDADEVGATLDNAAKYNSNLIKMVAENKVTPLGSSLDIYIFALFNENMKPGPTSERNFGLFQPDKMPVYSIRLTDSSSAVKIYNSLILFFFCIASIAIL
ncbi:glucan endo-1 [Quercus suber]|uniref:glucan endo-1,3-beta-D-glucosidase n=1 Tax=Quercus suber TaxID=58331 RepID=A0AAW0KRH7_QUESU